MRIADNVNSNLAENAITKILTMRHGAKDFFILNSEEFRKRVEQTMGTMTLLIVAIASISLLGAITHSYHQNYSSYAYYYPEHS